MEEQDKVIELYPGNWLNNASIVGFLFSLQKIESIDVSDFLFSDGRAVFPKELFSKLKVQERYFTEKLCECLIIGNVSKTSKVKYINYINPSNKGDKEGFEDYVRELGFVINNGHRCVLSNTTYKLSSISIKKLNDKWVEYGSKEGGFENFLKSITKVSGRINERLGGAESYPNGNWALKNSTYINPLFSFLVIHQHLAFTKLADYSNVFINAPTFQMMYELNKILMEMAGKENVTYRNLLAMSIVEFSIKTNVLLNSWTGMNMEIISIKKDKIEFISIPYNTVKLLSNKKIAELIGSIGDFKILNLVIDQKWDELVEIGYRLLKISMNGIGKEDRNFIGQFYTPEGYKTPLSIKNLANKLLKLYSLITERIKN